MADVTFLSGLRILIVGLGREGVALATYLAGRGLMVTATDMQPEEKLSSVAVSLREKGVSLHLGDHPVSLLDKADILFVSPGVPLETPLLQQAMLRKIPLSTESRLFCHLCLAPILGITGTSGKTTTTTLVGKIMEADGRKTWIGGNIGQPLIEVVDQIEPKDVVVMELSSFQLEYFHNRLNKKVDVKALPSAAPEQLARLLDNWSPPISAILNIKPNHLDRHPSMKHYIRAKRAIIDYQTAQGVIVMSLDNDMTRTIGNQFKGKVCWFSQEAQTANGAGLMGNTLALFDQMLKPQLLVGKGDIKLPGPHNIDNILAACLMTREAGASLEAMRSVITTFTGVEHRLQFIREHKQVSYYNDSISTSPDRLIAALHSFNEPIVLLVGGRDKHLPWEDAAWLILVRARDVILFGEAADQIGQVIETARSHVPQTNTAAHRCATLKEAVTLAAQIARPGDVVLLSPGCASFDAFRSFVERGERFRELVLQL